jgi:hypothetical protein
VQATVAEPLILGDPALGAIVRPARSVVGLLTS